MSKIRYYIRKNGTRFIFLMPKDLIEKHNFEHKDRFMVVPGENDISLTYNMDGKYKLTKDGNSLVINIAANDLPTRTVSILAKAEEIPYNIVGKALVMEVKEVANNLKGFHISKPVQKGFDLPGMVANG